MSIIMHVNCWENVALMSWMASHAEEKAHGLVRTPAQRTTWVAHTNRFLARVYPGPVRIDSTNMTPLPFWQCGVQLVALNFQRPETTPMQLNTALFNANGGCGYILKPPSLRCGTDLHSQAPLARGGSAARGRIWI